MVNERLPIAKVLMAGASGVGKTSLVNSLIFEGFTEVAPTIGVNFAQKVCQGETGPMNLSIWDLSGHPRFQCLMPRFCQGATGVVLVFDLTDPESLETAGQWLHYIASYNPPPHEYGVVLAGNKTDLQPQILRQRIQAFCKTHQIPTYIRCSAKTGENAKQVFNTLCAVIQHSHFGFTEPTRSLVQSPI